MAACCWVYLYLVGKGVTVNIKGFLIKLRYAIVNNANNVIGGK